MTAPDEPENGSYIAVRLLAKKGSGVRVYRRRDDVDDLNFPGAHWFSRSDPFEAAKTWQQLCEFGEIAYVGAFVDRSRMPAVKEEPWASL